MRAYAHFVDQFRAATGGITEWPCFRGERDRLPNEECYRMTPPHRMRGIWIDEFEGSRFIPGATSASSDTRSGPDIWLDDQSRGMVGLDRPPEGGRHVWLVDFVGVQTEYEGGYGHMSMSDHIVVVQQIRTMRLLEVRPPPPIPSVR